MSVMRHGEDDGDKACHVAGPANEEKWNEEGEKKEGERDGKREKREIGKVAEVEGEEERERKRER